MTIPYLMNCAHDGDGWCIGCVKKMGEALVNTEDEVRRLTAERDALIDNWPHDSSGVVLHDPKDGKFLVNDGAGVRFRTLRGGGAVRGRTGSRTGDRP